MACLNENEVLALIHGTLSGTELQSAQQHLQHCTDCLDLVTLVQQSYGDDNTQTEDLPAAPGLDDEPAEPGSFIGRYEVLRTSGRGGMGVVFEARDPELDRRVALKLVKPSLLGEEAQHFDRRLLREARAMARLSHPNVLTVYDVGVHEGQVFLASEWVDGETLEDWMKREHHWRTVVSCFRDAARGLVAAHEAGLVHRDFKPANVMLGKDERVRVFDFGLVRATVNSEGMNSTLGRNRVIGTPAYMSPEQMAGEAADERADQFSFCVSLYEALAGRRPFFGGDLLAIHAAIEAGCVDELKSVPRWLWDVVRKGLQRQAYARHPSMAALLELLEEGLGRRRRFSIAAVAGVCMVGAVVATGGLWSQSPSERTCSDDELELGEAWGQARQDAVHLSLLATQTPYAEDTWQRTKNNLDRYAEHWEYQSRASCIEVNKGAQNSAMRVQRSDCLAQARVEFDVLTKELQGASEDIVLRASILSGELAGLDRCSKSIGAPPTNLAKRQSLQGLWPEMKQLEILVATGKVETAAALAEELLPLAQGHRPSEARLWALRAAALDATGQAEAAVRAYEKAMYSATSGRDDELAAHATGQIYRYYTTQVLDPKESERWKQLAEAATERAASARVRGAWDGILGQAALEAGHYVQAVAYFQGGLEKFNAIDPPDERRIAAMSEQLGQAYLLAEDPGHAVAAFRDAAAHWQELVGSKHPDMALAQGWLAIAVALQGDAAEARELGEAAMATIVACYENSDPRIAPMLRLQAKRMAASGDSVGAIRTLLEALQLKRDGITLLDLAKIEALNGQHVSALALGREAMNVLEETTTREASRLRQARFFLGELLFTSAQNQLVESEAVILARESLGSLVEAGPGAKPLHLQVQRWLEARKQ